MKARGVLLAYRVRYANTRELTGRLVELLTFAEALGFEAMPFTQLERMRGLPPGLLDAVRENVLRSRGAASMADGLYRKGPMEATPYYTGRLDIVTGDSDTIEEAGKKLQHVIDCAHEQGFSLLDANLERLPENDPIEMNSWGSDKTFRNRTAQEQRAGETSSTLR